MGNNKSFYIHDNVLNNINQDKFGHKHIAKAVVNSVLHTDPPFIIGIFGGWGTGKSSLLKLIEIDLPKKQIETVSIDAWRYSSAENLQRAFLIHVAKEKAESLLDELRRKLYSSEQETIPFQPSRLDKNKKFSWKTIFDFVISFLLFALLTLVILFIVFGIQTVIINDSFKGFCTTFKWVEFLDKFLDLLFIPLVIPLINNLQMYVFQRPITISHERIDANEIFSEYFDKVVEKATEKMFGANKKLVIFVDNLDRLIDEKMVEALESLKTFINNEKCIFIVACDDNVVRSVINKSKIIPKINDDNEMDRRQGEHYLDKFFQQSFYLPEYMDFDLFDFAEKNFSSTKLCEKLVSEKVDIRNLISIILPTDIGSPRKAKRLLNDFIAIFDIVERRECQNEGQLRPGSITANPEFLGKFSTLRTEYPEFYGKLVADTGLLTRLTIAIQQDDKEKIDNILNSQSRSNNQSLVAYLRKTQTIMVDNLGPYIWLSQDALSLGLRREHILTLRNSLSNADIDLFEILLRDADTPDYRSTLVKVASRTVDQRLLGIEQQNGIKVLAHLLPQLETSIQPEIAHVLVKLIPQCPLDAFDASEVLYVLKWAHRGSATQKNKLIAQLVKRLDNQNLRKSTFSAILDNAEVIENSNATQEVQDWITNILENANQSELEVAEENITITVNREFAEWLIGQLNDYKDNHFVLEKYFSGALINYMFVRIVNGFKGVPAINLNSDGLGQDIEAGLNIIAEAIGQGAKYPQFWKGLPDLLGNGIIYGYNFASNIIKKLIDEIPEKTIVNLLIAILEGMVEITQSDDEAIETNWLQTELDLVLSLYKKVDGDVSDEKAIEISNIFSSLSHSKKSLEVLLNFTETISKKFQDKSHHPFIFGIADSFKHLGETKKDGEITLKTLITQDYLLEDTNRVTIAENINNWILSNNEIFISNATKYVSLLSNNPEYQKLFNEYASAWAEIIQNDSFTLFNMKVDFIYEAINLNFFDADIFIEKIIPLFPFGSEQEKLSLVMETVAAVTSKINAEMGAKLFSIVMAHITHFGPNTNKALMAISGWTNGVDEADKLSFSNKLFAQFQEDPETIVGILSNIWEYLPNGEIKRHVLCLYSTNLNNDLIKLRSKNVKAAIMQFNKSERTNLIVEIWNELIAQENSEAKEFISSAIITIDLSEVLQLRNSAIDEIRQLGASPKSEINLKFLCATIRDDVREVMPVVDLFVNLFGRGNPDIILGTKYVVPALKPLDIRNDHKHRLAEAMGQAALRSSDEINDEIHEKASQLGLMWFSYRKYWK